MEHVIEQIRHYIEQIMVLAGYHGFDNKDIPSAVQTIHEALIKIEEAIQLQENINETTP